MKYYTVKEVAELFKVVPKTVYLWTYEGKLKFSKMGNMIRISQEDLDEFIVKK